MFCVFFIILEFYGQVNNKVMSSLPHRKLSVEPRSEKTSLRGFRPGPTQTGLYSHRRWLEAWNFVFRKQRNCSSYLAKTKALISFTVTAKLICVFVFAYAKSRFSHDEAQLSVNQPKIHTLND